MICCTFSFTLILVLQLVRLSGGDLRKRPSAFASFLQSSEDFAGYIKTSCADDGSGVIDRKIMAQEKKWQKESSDQERFFLPELRSVWFDHLLPC